MLARLVVPCALAALLVPALAHADGEAPPSAPPKERHLGDAGSYALTLGGRMSFDDQNSRTLASVALVPAVDVFVADRFSIGLEGSFKSEQLQLGLSNWNGETQTLTTVGGGPRIGYDAKITDNVGLWPRLAIELVTAKATDDYSNQWGSYNGPNGHSHGLELELAAPLVVTASRHFVISAGPTISLLAPMINVREAGNVPAAIRAGFELALGFTD